MQAVSPSAAQLVAPMMTIHSHDADLSYEISVTDSAGQDHSQQFQVFQSLPNAPSNTMQKRAYSRALDSCPNGEVFTTSYCREGISPQAYVLVCSDNLDHSWYFRRCAPNEVCISGIPKQNPPSPNGQLVPPTLKAYCVQADNFVKIAADQLSHTTKPGVIGSKYKAPEGQTMAVEAVLTDQNMTETIFASKLEMSAQTSDTLNNVQTWRSQVGGLAACTDCARILIAPVPDKTQRIIIRVVLEAAAAGGLLFLSQVSLSSG